MSAPAKPRTMSKPLTVACWGAALLPALMGLAAHLTGPRAQAAVNERRLPALAFAQYMVYERDADLRPYYRAWYSFSNTGDSPVKVTELKPSCGCLNPKLEQRTFQPGERGEFTIDVDPTQQKPGTREFFVDVHYKDPEPQVARLTYKVDLPTRKVELAPRALIFSQLSDSGKSTTQRVVISDYRTRHFSVREVESTSDLVTVALADKTEDETGNLHVSFDVTVAGQVPPGTSRAIINVTTDDSQFPRLQVPILIQGRSHAVAKEDLPLQFDPKTLFLRPESSGPFQTRLTLHDLNAEPAEIIKAYLTSVDGRVQVGPLELGPEGPLARRRTITLTLTPPANPDEHKALLVLETSSELQPRLEVPIVIDTRPLAQ